MARTKQSKKTSTTNKVFYKNVVPKKQKIIKISAPVLTEVKKP
jgi:hypothetical protein